MNCKYLRRNKLKHDHSGISKNCRILHLGSETYTTIKFCRSFYVALVIWRFPRPWGTWGTWYLVRPGETWWNQGHAPCFSNHWTPTCQGVPILSRTGFSRFFCCVPIVVVERYTRYLGKLPEVAKEARLGQDPVRSLERPFAPSNPGTFYARAVDGT